MNIKLTTEQFIEKAREVHSDKYDYSKVEYINSKTKVCIICPEHGEFWQTPNSHLCGYGCPKCGRILTSESKKLNTPIFIEKAKKIHGDKYDYSKVDYVNSSIKVCIICPEHGMFFMRPNDHLCGQGCPKCGNIMKKIKQTESTENFIEKAKKIHGDKYDYSKVNYTGAYVKVCIICPKHGEFWQTPTNHIRGNSCPVCAKENRIKLKSSTTSEFIAKAKAIHGNYYDYSKVNYINRTTKVCIICPEHGEFWQTPQNHLQGKGCFECSKILNSNESRLFRLIEEKYKNFNVIRQYHNTKILGRKSIDIYFLDKKIGIEYQGGQHFKPINMFGGYKSFLELASRDKEKYDECINNNIKLFYFTFDKKTVPKNYIDNVYCEFDDLCNAINIYIKKRDDL